jgi:hypothetical protein
MQGYVYLGFDHSGYGIKIGKTSNIERRTKEIRNMNLTFVIFLQFQCDNMDYTEKELHKTYSNKRVTGEWFDLTSTDIADIVKRITGRDMDDEWKASVKTMTGIAE